MGATKNDSCSSYFEINLSLKIFPFYIIFSYLCLCSIDFSYARNNGWLHNFSVYFWSFSMIFQLLFAFMALVRENHDNRKKYPWERTARFHLLESVSLKKRAVWHHVEIVESKNCARRWKFKPVVILSLWSWAHWLSYFEG